LAVRILQVFADFNTGPSTDDPRKSLLFQYRKPSLEWSSEDFADPFRRLCGTFPKMPYRQYARRGRVRDHQKRELDFAAPGHIHYFNQRLSQRLPFHFCVSLAYWSWDLPDDIPCLRSSLLLRIVSWPTIQYLEK
jgi:hypothetical protein